jgi:hypothetical protein
MHHGDIDDDGDGDAIKVLSINRSIYQSIVKINRSIHPSINRSNLSIDQGRGEYTCDSMDDAVLLKAMHMVIFVIEANEPQDASITASLAKATAK